MSWFSSRIFSGDGCNSDLTDVSALLSTGNVASCYQCNFTQNTDGTVTGMQNCGKENGGSSTTCPAYADAACFTASSYHQDYSGNVTKEQTDDFKGNILNKNNAAFNFLIAKKVFSSK